MEEEEEDEWSGMDLGGELHSQQRVDALSVGHRRRGTSKEVKR